MIVRPLRSATDITRAILEVEQNYEKIAEAAAQPLAQRRGWEEVAGETMTLVRDGVTLQFGPSFATVRFVEGIVAAGGPNVLTAGEPEMRAALKAKGVAPEESAKWTGGKLLDEVFKVFLEPTLIQPTFVIDYPISLSPLAKKHRKDPELVERFERDDAEPRRRLGHVCV